MLSEDWPQFRNIQSRNSNIVIQGFPVRLTIQEVREAYKTLKMADHSGGNYSLKSDLKNFVENVTSKTIIIIII